MKTNIKINLYTKENENKDLLNCLNVLLQELNCFIKDLNSSYDFERERASIDNYYALQIRATKLIEFVFGQNSEEYIKVKELFEVPTDGKSVVPNLVLKNCTGILKGYLQSAQSYATIQKGNKKYQFFVSSTYKDLVNIRNVFMNVIARTGHFFSGMEDFRTVPMNQLEYLAKNIQDSDYYILVLGKNYGSIIKDKNISYTEYEFEIARQLGKPMLLFICNNSDILTGEMETEQKKKKFETFAELVKSVATPCYFDSEKDLEIKLTNCIHDTIQLKPQQGWTK